jgi:hypothetical protein
MLAEEGWRDIVICNVSSRGMMLRCDEPPIRNTFIEVRHRNAIVVGRVIWSHADSCGIYSQNTINAAALTSPSLVTVQGSTGERREEPRASGYHMIQTQRLSTEASSRIFARLFDWSAIVFAAVIGAIFVAGIVQDTMQAPFEKVGQAMVTPPSTKVK